MPAGSMWTATGACAGAQEVMTHPGSIVVGAEAAVLLRDQKANRLSAWGARDVRLGDPAPSLFPGRTDWTTTRAEVVDPEFLLNVFNSCRSCSLARTRFNPVQGYFPDQVAYLGQLNGADLRGATLGGDLSFWSFNNADLGDADLSGASLGGAVLDHTKVDATDFDGADLRGAQLNDLRYDRPPQLTRIQVGRYGGWCVGYSGGQCVTYDGASCTVVKDTDLVAAKLTLAGIESGCEATPLAPRSSVPLGLLSQIAETLHAQRRVNLADVRFVATAADRAALAGADLSGANLTRVSFAGFPARFVKTTFDNASLAGASFDLADLTGASFHDVSAAGTSFQGADLSEQGDVKGANLSGPKTVLTNANFVGADLSGAGFVGADLSGAVFSRALAADTNFNGVRARDASFADAHVYGNGQAFDSATDMRGVDFDDAVLAGDIDQSGGFNLTNTDLTGAKFDGAQCVGCNFAGSTLDEVNFTGAYLPGASFAGVLGMHGAKLLDVRLYCGDRDNSTCKTVGSSGTRWAWPLALGAGEEYGPVPFANTDFGQTSLGDVAACPDGKAGAANPPGCTGHLQPEPENAPPLPARCSAAGATACPSDTATVFADADVGAPVALARATPPTWATALTERGMYAAFDDGTVRLVGNGSPTLVAGRHGKACAQATDACGDGGPADQALLGTPSALAVGLDGSLYIADPALHRVRRIDPSGRIGSVAGDGRACATPEQDCGGGRATEASLAGPYGVWVDPGGELFIADGPRGIRKVGRDGTLVGVGAKDFDVRSVVGVPGGALYASTNNPDHIVRVDQDGGGTTKVVGTGTSGYNGNTNKLGTLAPGTSVQVDGPQGLSVALDGDILFADTGNHLVRAYVPGSGHVVDDLAGVVADGKPSGGFNGDGHWADETQLSRPQAASAGRSGLIAVADSGNRRVRQFGPSPLR
jgi:uncharacterized protein YjbI with pentapeptide repeats